MNRINFIKPVPPNRIKEVRIWFLFMFILIAATLLILIIYSITQWYIYRTIHREKQKLQQQLNAFSSTMATQHKQVKERDFLQQQLNKLTKYSKSPKNPIEFLTALHTSLGTLPMQSITITKNNFELHTLCTHAQQANTFLQKLTQNKHIQSAKLTSLQTDQKQLMAIFKGKIKM